MKSEKRMVGDYTVLCAVNIGSREIILAENEQSANGERFLCCYGERNDIFEKFTECAVGDDYRNYGIGTELMKQMLMKLKLEGYKQASLAVQKMNYAVRMYRKVGFEIVDENDEEYIMICNL